MTKIAYSRHANYKFGHEKYVSQLNITKKIVKATIEKPYLKNTDYPGKTVVIGSIDNLHSLAVVYTHAGDIIKVITFFPIKTGGSYENKIRQSR